MRRPRHENVEEALELRADGLGLTIKEIADRMGVNYKTVYEWLEDPAGERSNGRKRRSERAAIEARRCEKCGGVVGSLTSVLCSTCHAKQFEPRRAEILALRADGVTNREIDQRLGLPYNAAAITISRCRAKGVVVNRSPYRERGKDKNGMNQAARKSLERDRERTAALIEERKRELHDLEAYLGGIDAALAAFAAAMGSVNGHGEDTPAS